MIDQIIKAVFRELLLHRVATICSFAGVALLVLVAAWFWPKKYESSAVIFADESNIIKPLLAGSAQTTRVNNRARVVLEVIQSRRLMSQIVEEANLLKGNESPSDIELTINMVREKILVTDVGPNYIRIVYKAPSANEAYRVASTITDLFLKDSADTKRNESREAYTFIDKQVNSYKSQLQTAENALKEFNANNVDGTEDTVNLRIDNLRSGVETIQLDIEGLETKRRSMESQLANENKFSKHEYRASVYHQQIGELKARLAAMKLSLTDTHPDVINLTLQIADMEKLAEEQETSTENKKESVGSDINPLYQELRSKLAEVNVELKTQTSRLSSTLKLLESENERRKRIAESRAELAELTRDYNVTKAIYEDMLERKEKARLSMTLDIEGQGVTYKIQEPAVYPLTPVGIRFIHLFFAGPVLGLLVPIAFIILFVQIDPRIRFEYRLKEDMELPLIGVIPHVTTSITNRLIRRDIFMLSSMVLAVIIIYTIVALIRLEIINFEGVLGGLLK